ncbi:peptide chain release factor N(5)-glutamine methyltransferase [Candidatus Parcubacteria bacterium]|nr:MAG: peptide chain release factor N(5)-glutamine methyltransferase [Candidatus Parcubacteria bacterium]
MDKLTIGQTISQYYQILPPLEADILISETIKKSREFILTHPQFCLSDAQSRRLQKLAQQRLEGEPIAYLIKKQEFYGLTFYVNKRVLIPRPETEILVERALEFALPQKMLTVVDVGTGSGCIIITLAHLLQKQKKIDFKKWELIGLDISTAALKVARRNARAHQLDKYINFKQGNLLKPLKKLPQHMLITANLPYLTPQQFRQSPSIQSEPKLALVGGKDGLKYYRQLLQELSRLKYTSLKWAAFLEIDPSQKNTIIALVKKYCPNSELSFYADLSGYCRVIKIVNVTKTATLRSQ